MQVAALLDHSELKKYIKTIKAGEYLFRQGDPSDSMFLIIDGTVRLIAENGNQEHVEGVLERGQFLGEVAICGDITRRRVFSAKAKTYTTCLKLSPGDFAMLETKVPDLMLKLMKEMFRIAADRLNNCNERIRLLRSSDNMERFVYLIDHFCRVLGRKVPEGVEVLLSEESFDYYLDMDREEIAYCLNALIEAKVINRKLNDYFTVPSTDALLNSIDHLRELKAQREAPKGMWPFGRRKAG